MKNFDLVVIGSGPAGQNAALQAAKLHKRVAIIEKEALLGGAGINTGTLPSKTIKDAIYHLHGYKLRSFLNVSHSLKKSITFRDLISRQKQVTKYDENVIRNKLEQNNIEIIYGTASFLDIHTVKVVLRNGDVDTLTASFIMIATGSRPRRSDDIPFDDHIICDSDSILTTESSPGSLAVVGGGVIGTEYASMFSVFGLTITLIERRNSLLRFLDQEITNKLTEHSQANGVTFLLGKEIAKVFVNQNKKVVTELKSGEVIITDMFLYAMGRNANTDLLNLSTAGISTDTVGQIKVNEFYQTDVPHIYAAGDVIGFPALTSTSLEQGRRAACHAFEVPIASIPKIWPYGIYTIPEISMVGKTEEELITESVPYEVGRAFYREIARGQIAGDTQGFMKLVFHRDTRKLLGVHIIGDSATELIHIGQCVITYGGTVDFFIDNVFNYPTLAECYRTAALDGTHRL